MALLTPYDLPFTMTVPAPGDLAKHGDFSLRVAVRGPVSEQGLEALGSIVTSWGVLANTGAMCGEYLPASKSGIDDWTRPILGSSSISWALSGTRVDDRAATILAHLLFSEWESVRFERVDLFAPSAPQSTTRLVFDEHANDPYPGIDRTTRFSHAIGSEIMEQAVVEVHFASPPTPAQCDDVHTELLTWAAIASVGAYAIAPIHPLECGLIPEEALEWVDDEARWGLARVRVHAGAFAGLANVLSAVDQRVLAIRALSID